MLNKKRILVQSLLLVFSFSTGCAHYPVNQPIKEVRPDVGYRAATMKTPENGGQLQRQESLMLTAQGQRHTQIMTVEPLPLEPNILHLILLSIRTAASLS